MTAPATPATGLDLDALADKAWTEAFEPHRIVRAAKTVRDATGLPLRDIVPALRRAESRTAEVQRNDLRVALAELVRLHDEPGDGPETEEAYDRVRNLLAKVPPKDGVR